MKKEKAISVIMVTLVFMLTIAGCGNVGKHRSPEDWLSLSYSGLAATDQYDFTGSMSIKTDGGLAFKPEVFEGKVVDHQQLTLQTNSQETMHWNPVKVLETLNQSNDEVRIVSGSNDEETVTLLITENAKVSKEKWEQRLRQQLDQLGANMPSKDKPFHQEWMEELARSRSQLDAMLSTMQAATEYELVIDRTKLLPLKMEEKTSFQYTYNKRPFFESRYTTVRFQSFNGALSNTVQQMHKRVTMD